MRIEILEPCAIGDRFLAVGDVVDGSDETLQVYVDFGYAKPLNGGAAETATADTEFEPEDLPADEGALESESEPEPEPEPEKPRPKRTSSGRKSTK